MVGDKVEPVTCEDNRSSDIEVMWESHRAIGIGRHRNQKDKKTLKP